MQCNCGDKSKSSVWMVTTENKIREWLGFDHIGPVMMPMKIYTETCESCGRMKAKMFEATTNKLIAVKG